MYKGRCAGRIIEISRRMFGCQIADHFEIGKNEIRYCNKLFATISWLYDSDIPFFNITEEFQEKSLQQTLFWLKIAAAEHYYSEDADFVKNLTKGIK